MTEAVVRSTWVKKRYCRVYEEQNKSYSEDGKYLRLLETIVHELSCFGAHYWRMPIASFLCQEHLHCSPEALPYRTYDMFRSCFTIATRSFRVNNVDIPYRANAILCPPVTV